MQKGRTDVTELTEFGENWRQELQGGVNTNTEVPSNLRTRAKEVKRVIVEMGENKGWQKTGFRFISCKT
jgi:hypothetical protein